jgi:hypothetical protein
MQFAAIEGVQLESGLHLGAANALNASFTRVDHQM